MEKSSIRSIIAIIFGLIFPIFGIFIYTKWNYMGVELYSDILINLTADFKTAFFYMFTSPFKGDFFNQISQKQLFALISQPTMSAMFTWAITGYFIGLFTKKLKKSTLITILTQIILLVLFIIALAIQGTITIYFENSVDVFLGSIFISFVFALVGNGLGYIAGRI